MKELRIETLENKPIVETLTTKKSYGRHRYFQLYICSNLAGPKTNLWIDSMSLIPLLVANKFIPIGVLERQLYKLEFKYEKKLIKIVNFYGQLERNKLNGAPFWNILVETTAGVTVRNLVGHLSKNLLKKEKPIDLGLKVHAVPKLLELKKEDRFVIAHPKWSPSFFCKKFFEANQIIKKKEFQELIEEQPKKYFYLIKKLTQINNIPNDK